MDKILFIAYDDIRKPILHSQGLPFLNKIAEKYNRICGIVTFENRLFDENFLSDKYKNLKWYPIISKVGFLKPQSIFDIIRGIKVVCKIVKKYDYQIIHARSYIAGFIGMIVAFLLKRKFIFDMRGLYPDEYVLSGYMKKRGLLYKIYKFVEYLELKRSDKIVVVSNRFFHYLSLLYGEIIRYKIEVIPNRVDLEKFKYSNKKRNEFRKKLKIKTETLVFSYVGSLAKWQLWKLSIDYFKVIFKFKKNIFYLFLTYERNIEEVEEYFKINNIPLHQFKIVTLLPEEIPFYLYASDFGFMFNNDDTSRQVSAPIKFGEYLASGVPVITNYGIGDTTEYILKYKVGIVYSFNDLKNENILYKRFNQFYKKYYKNIKRKCLEIAKKEFDLNDSILEYERIYEELSRKKS